MLLRTLPWPVSIVGQIKLKEPPPPFEVIENLERHQRENWNICSRVDIRVSLMSRGDNDAFLIAVIEVVANANSVSDLKSTVALIKYSPSWS